MTCDEEVRAIISEKLGVVGFADEARLVDGLGADDLDIVELVLQLEKELGIDIPDDSVGDLATVADVIHACESRIAEKAA